MVYHSTFTQDSCRVVCGCALLPLRTKARGPAPHTEGPDALDEAIAFFRANVLFRNFEVKGPTDKLLLYLTLYISACLKRLADAQVLRPEADKLLYSMAHEPFQIPGDPGFALGGLMPPPATKEDQECIRGYLRQSREEIGRRMLDHCFNNGGLVMNKFWLAFAQRRFLNKAL